MKILPEKFSGKKGGGSSSPSPTSTPDNLRSKDTVEVVLGLCEGPILGLADGSQRNFNVGDTPLQNSDGSLNFKVFSLDILSGLPSGETITPVLGGSETNNSSVQVSMTSGNYITRQTLSGDIDVIEFRILVSRLMTSNTSGTFTASATYRIQYKRSDSATWITAFGSDVTISGKTTSAYVKETRVNVPRITDPGVFYDIRVQKVSADSGTEYFADLVWESWQEVNTNPKEYPDTAIAHLVAESSDQFSSIPQWSGVYDGLLCHVPTNYDPETRVYTGIWDGSWQIAWTNNPAWALYELVTNERFGLKKAIPEIQMDKYDVYDAAVWCDTPVPDGEGGTQPRYTYNGLVSEPRQAMEFLRYLAGTFNATFFDDYNGSLFLRVDKDDDAVHIFTKENTISGFAYTYTDLESRYNDITVSFTNPDLNWETDRRRVYDRDLIDQFGSKTLDFAAVGCTNVREAIRRAQYKLITSNTETRVVSFSTNRLGQYVKPFDVMLICDPDLGTGLSGRIKSLSLDGKVVTLRDPLYLEAGVAYIFKVQLTDGTIFSTTLEGTELGNTTTLNLVDALLEYDTSSPPELLLPEKAVFTLEHSTYAGAPRPFRVMKCEEEEGSTDRFNIEGVSINRNKWNDSDNVTFTDELVYSVLPDPLNPPGPTTCSFIEEFVFELKQFHLIITPTFDRAAYKYYTNDHSFEVWSREHGTGESFVKREVVFGDTIIDHPPGSFDFKILGKSYLGKTTPLDRAATYTFNVTNPLTPPADVDFVKINDREVFWGYADPPNDFAGFRVRYHNEAGRLTWDDANQPHQGLLSATSFYTNLIPASARVILVKAVDVFDVESANVGYVLKDPTASDTYNVFDETEFYPTWGGTLTGCFVDTGDNDYLKADDPGTAMYSGVSSARMYTGTSGDSFYAASFGEMTYEDAFTVTIAGELLYTVDLDAVGYEVSYRADGETTWTILPGRTVIEPGDYDIKIRLFGGSTRGVLRAFTVLVDVPDLVEDLQDVAISSAGTRLVPTKTYSQIKKVDVTIQDDGVNAAMGYRLFDKNPTLGPLIVLYDADGVATDGLVDATLKGIRG